MVLVLNSNFKGKVCNWAKTFIFGSIIGWNNIPKFLCFFCWIAFFVLCVGLGTTNTWSNTIQQTKKLWQALRSWPWFKCKKLEFIQCLLYNVPKKSTELYETVMYLLSRALRTRHWFRCKKKRLKLSSWKARHNKYIRVYWICAEPLKRHWSKMVSFQILSVSFEPKF